MNEHVLNVVEKIAEEKPPITGDEFRGNRKKLFKTVKLFALIISAGASSAASTSCYIALLVGIS